MSLSDMVLFNTQIQKVATETVDQAVRKFNEASNNALIMGNEEHIGDYIEEASFKVISSLISRRDASGSGAVAAQPLQQLQDVSVKVDTRVGPVEWTLEQFNRLGKSEEEAGLIIGEQAAEAMLADYLNVSAGALNAAILNAGLDHDGTAAAASMSALNAGASLFGDRSSSLVCWLMHSGVWHGLVDEAITNTNRLFRIGDINVMEDGLGRRYVVSDIANLFAAGAPNIYSTLGLTMGAVQIKTGRLHSTTVDLVKQENIGKVWQGETSFNVGLKGYAWDKVNGGSSPTNAALLTGTNWDKVVTSNKDTAGVLVRTQ